MVETFFPLDTRVLEILYAMRDPSLVQTFIWISELGRVATVYGIAICIALGFVLYRHYAYAAGLAIAMASSGLGIIFMKGLVARARPAETFQAYLETWYSFPSAHAALTTSLSGFLAYLAFTKLKSKTLRYLALLGCLLVIAAVSFARIYLGVHFLSDVIAGVLLGAVCAYFGAAFTKRAHV